MATGVDRTALLAPRTGDRWWIHDALNLGGADVRPLVGDRDPTDAMFDAPRLASVGLGLLDHLGLGSFAEVRAADIAPVILTGPQGRAWQSMPGLLGLLRCSVRGRTKGVKFVVCAGCHRWLLARAVPTTKSCPITLGCEGVCVAIEPGIVSAIPPHQ